MGKTTDNCFFKVDDFCVVKHFKVTDLFIIDVLPPACVIIDSKRHNKSFTVLRMNSAGLMSKDCSLALWIAQKPFWPVSFP